MIFFFPRHRYVMCRSRVDTPQSLTTTFLAMLVSWPVRRITLRHISRCSTARITPRHAEQLRSVSRLFAPLRFGSGPVLACFLQSYPVVSRRATLRGGIASHSISPGRRTLISVISRRAASRFRAVPRQVAPRRAASCRAASPRAPSRHRSLHYVTARSIASCCAAATTEQRKRD